MDNMFTGANSFRANLSRWCVANVIRYNETTMFNDTQMDPNDYCMNSCPTNYVVSTALTNTATIIAGSVLTVMVVLTAYL